MTGWSAKRFWQAARAEACEGGFTVRLDARAVKTPAKAALVVPTLAMAEAIAAEWDAQTGLVQPETMPVTRRANSALDKVTPLFDAVVDEVAGFGASDLLCYRAEAPTGLIARQAAGWDPLVHWSATTLGAPLLVTAGIVPIDQPGPSLDRMRAEVAALSPFALTALHDLVAITGSLILGLAVTRGHLAPEEAFELSRIDEAWQIETWGEDEIAAATERHKRTALLEAARFYGLCG